MYELVVTVMIYIPGEEEIDMRNMWHIYICMHACMHYGEYEMMMMKTDGDGGHLHFVPNIVL